MRFKNGGDYRFLSQHLSISWGNWGWGLVFYFIGWQRPLAAIFKEFKHPRFQRRKNSLVEIWTFAFFKHLWQDGFHFWIALRTTKLAPIKTMFQQIKAVFFFYFLFIRFTFRFLTKKFILELFPLLQSWSFQGWTKNWFDNNFNHWYVRRMDLVRFSRLERSDMAGSVAENYAEEF